MFECGAAKNIILWQSGYTLYSIYSYATALVVPVVTNMDLCVLANMRLPDLHAMNKTYKQVALKQRTRPFVFLKKIQMTVRFE